MLRYVCYNFKDNFHLYTHSVVTSTNSYFFSFPTRFELKLVDEFGINQTRSFQIPSDVIPGSNFEYEWGVLGFGEVQSIFVKENDGRVDGPWYFVEQVVIGECCYSFS